MTLEERLMNMEKDLRSLAAAFSKQSGELQAVEAALCGCLLIAGGIPQVREQVAAQLEKCLVMNLSASTNEIRNKSFEETAELIRLALNDQAEQLKQASNNSSEG